MSIESRLKAAEEATGLDREHSGARADIEAVRAYLRNPPGSDEQIAALRNCPTGRIRDDLIAKAERLTERTD